MRDPSYQQALELHRGLHASAAQGDGKVVKVMVRIGGGWSVPPVPLTPPPPPKATTALTTCPPSRTARRLDLEFHLAKLFAF